MTLESGRPCPREASTVDRLRGLIEVTRLIRAEVELPTVLAAIARTVSDSLAFRTVAINLYRPAWDDFWVSTVHGSEAASRTLIGETLDRDAWERILEPRFLRRGAYLIPHGEIDWSTLAGRTFIADIEPRDHPDAWHPEDALVVPMPHSDGHLLGILSVDEPASGSKPSDEELDVLVAVAEHAAIAVQGAQEAAEAARHRAALERLLAVSARLTETLTSDAVLQAICDGINDALGFENVAIELVDRATGLFEAGAVAGWSRYSDVVTVAMTVDELRPLVDHEFEIEGCYLLPASVAESRTAERIHVYHSASNGRGPWAWQDHWLYVPLYGRDGSILGVIWVDDPEDRLLPSKERLQALRLFANQATTALASAAQFEEARFLADHDPLTRLFNRRAFIGQLEAELDRSERYGEAFSLVLCDLNDLKALNDCHGHLAGDEALRLMAGVLTRELRRSDRAFRIGGDEFALLLVGATEARAADAVARIAEALEASQDATERLSASFGCACFPADGREPEQLMRAADQAMYAAKRSAERLRG